VLSHFARTCAPIHLRYHYRHPDAPGEITVSLSDTQDDKTFGEESPPPVAAARAFDPVPEGLHAA